jgi:hypothetical protein
MSIRQWVSKHMEKFQGLTLFLFNVPAGIVCQYNGEPRLFQGRLERVE